MMVPKKTKQIEKEINPHFEDFIFNWKTKTYFLVGGYGSSKSYNTALKLIYKLAHEKRTCLVVRNVFETIRDSCYSLFEEIVTELELDKKIKCVQNPMQVRFPNGSKIIFRGLDKPAKLKSIHNVSIVWIEECAEIKYEAFKELLGRLRHPTLDLYMILTSNPVAKSNWSFKHFFKTRGFDDDDLYKQRVLIKDETYYHHSVVDDNLFLPQSYRDELEKIKEYDLDLYRIARQGKYGVTGLLVLPQFEVLPHYAIMQEVLKLPTDMKKVGMDFGFETSYNAVVRLAIDHVNKYLYIYYEYYKRRMTDDQTAIELEEFRRTQELIKSDCAEPKSIRYYQQQGFNMRGARKFQGSRTQYTKKVKRFHKIFCSDVCINVIEELKELAYKTDKDGEIIEDEFNIDPHTLSAIWYALDDYEVSDLKNYGLINVKGVT